MEKAGRKETCSLLKERGAKQKLNAEACSALVDLVRGFELSLIKEL